MSNAWNSASSESFTHHGLDGDFTIPESYIDLDHAQKCKHGQYVCGDVFLSRKIKEEGRIVSVLADGLGSGVKASVLATLTATMALKYTTAFVDVRKSARTIMDTLPICEVRRISYSTFTVVDLDEDGTTRLVEHGNPSLILLRGAKEVVLEKDTFTLEEWQDRIIEYTDFRVELGDRLIWFSDGVTQCGMGQKGMPLGWGRDKVVRFVSDIVAKDPDISSKRLAERIVAAAAANDASRARDDITCAVACFRHPRRLLVITGPPFFKERDLELAELVRTFQGRIAICGGTTATIVSRRLGRSVAMDLAHLDPEIPPFSVMDGVDIITEGTLTLARLAEVMERGCKPEDLNRNAVRSLLTLMLDSDIVEFMVGTRINEAHQDPNVPVELDLRRNIVRKIASLLETRHLKEAHIRFL